MRANFDVQGCVSQRIAGTATRVLLAFAVATTSPLLNGQTYAELTQLVFYPVPLAEPGTCPPDSVATGCPPATRTAQYETVDMAMFEESPIDQYLADIELAENERGAYADVLIEKLLAIGLSYQQQGQHEEALSNLDRAAGLSRVHRGLYSPEQIKLTEHAIESLRALGRSEQLAERYSSLLDIYHHVHGPQSLETAGAMLSIGIQKRKQIEQLLVHSATQQSSRNNRQREYSGDGMLAEILAAKILFSDAIRIHVEQKAWSAPTLFELESELIRILYLDAQRNHAVATSLKGAGRTETARSRLHARANRKEVPTQYRDGEQAYRRMIGYLKQDESASIEKIADVMANLADWHLLFGEHDKAMKQYGQLRTFLELAQVPPTEAKSILAPALPQPLPAFFESPLSATAVTWEDDRSGAISGYIDVKFNLSRSGIVTGLDVLDNSESADPRVIRHLVSQLRQARFRPGSDLAAVRYYFGY